MDWSKQSSKVLYLLFILFYIVLYLNAEQDKIKLTTSRVDWIYKSQQQLSIDYPPTQCRNNMMYQDQVDLTKNTSRESVNLIIALFYLKFLCVF